MSLLPEWKRVQTGATAKLPAEADIMQGLNFRDRGSGSALNLTRTSLAADRLGFEADKGSVGEPASRKTAAPAVIACPQRGRSNTTAERNRLELKDSNTQLMPSSWLHFTGQLWTENLFDSSACARLNPSAPDDSFCRRLPKEVPGQELS